MTVFYGAQGRSAARVIEAYRDIERIIQGVEKRCGVGQRIPKKAFCGTVVKYDFRQQFPSAYKYTPDSTHFNLYFENNKWYIDIDSVKRGNCPILAQYR